MEPGAVRLRVADPEAQREFYERAIGLRAIEGANGVIRLGAGGGGAVVELVQAPGAPPRPPGTTGLFHLAILVPDRPELAAALARVVRAGGRLTGASDHLVSEALYLNDPEGNGIEIYRDRDRSEWDYEDGQVRMSTLPLDVQQLLTEVPDDEPAAGDAPGGTRIGHVHLNVADLGEAERFYGGLLGFDVTVRDYPGALFLSTGGYHHHIGVNTWAGPGAPAPPPGSLGLEWFELHTDEPALAEIHELLERSGEAVEQVSDGVLTRDPSGNAVLITSTSGRG